MTEIRTVPGKIIARGHKTNGQSITFTVEFDGEVTKVRFLRNNLVFHTYDWGQDTSTRRLGFDMFNSWLHDIDELDYLKLMKAARLAQVSCYGGN